METVSLGFREDHQKKYAEEWLDGEHVIFGEVLDGKDVILSMETLAVFQRPCRGTVVAPASWKDLEMWRFGSNGVVWMSSCVYDCICMYSEIDMIDTHVCMPTLYLCLWIYSSLSSHLYTYQYTYMLITFKV